MGIKNRSDFGLRLERLRGEADLTQAEISERLGISRSTYNGYELGRITPPTDVLMRMADMYHVSCDYLLGRTPERRPAADEIAAKLRTLAMLCDPHGAQPMQYDDLRALVVALIGYYHTSLRSGNAPLAGVRDTLAALTEVVRAASGDSLSALHLASNALSVAALDATQKIISEYIK